MSDRLQQTITVLQSRFGSAAPHYAAAAIAARSSGIPELDALTGIGGWPIGRLSLLAGPRGSGKRTLAQRTVAFSTRDSLAVYVDLRGRLDPDFLYRLGGDLDRLLIVRPKHLREAMESARILARAGASFVCVDLARAGEDALDAELPHLAHRAEEAACSVLFLQDEGDRPADGQALRYYASLVITLRRKAWVFKPDGDLAGLDLEAVAVKNRLAAPGRYGRWVMPYPIDDSLS